MAYARLLSVEYILNNTIIDKNVDAKYIEVAIDDAQRINIPEALGYNLYTAIVNMVADNSIMEPVNINYYNLLVDQIQLCHAQWVIYHILNYLNYHLTNKSISTKSSDNGTPVEQEIISSLRTDAKSKAEVYIARIREQIVNNTGWFPEYWTTSGIDRIMPKALNYDDLFYMGSYARIPSGVTIENDRGCC